jgi:hypothetical protein
MGERIEGGCFCGSIRYNLEKKDYSSSNCNCSMCRRISGAAFVSWMAVPKSNFEYSQGEPKKLISSSHGTRYFCKKCGTHVVCLLEEYPEYIYITICSLDKPQDFKPKGDMYIDDKLPWIEVAL